jgi:hypothetical protein
MNVLRRNLLMETKKFGFQFYIQCTAHKLIILHHNRCSAKFYFLGQYVHDTSRKKWDLRSFEL